MKKNLVEAAEGGDRLETLIALRDLLADKLQNTTSSRDISSMSRRLMQCISEIEVLEEKKAASAKGDFLKNMQSIAGSKWRGDMKLGTISGEHEYY